MWISEKVGSRVAKRGEGRVNTAKFGGEIGDI